MLQFESNSVIASIDGIDYKGVPIVELQWHKVSGDNSHTLLRITPSDQSHFKTNKNFHLVDGNKNLYLTIGAGPEWGKLVSDLNRKSDAEPHTGKYRQVARPNKYRTESDFIDQLLANDANYGDHLDYDLFPATVGNERWWVADDGYNSNSYVSGLLLATDVRPLPQPTVTVPGYQKPVPKEYFQAKQQ